KMLVNRGFSSFQRGNFSFVVVYRNDLVTDFGKAGRRNKSNIARSDHRDSHTLFILLTHESQNLCCSTATNPIKPLPNLSTQQAPYGRGSSDQARMTTRPCIGDPVPSTCRKKWSFVRSLAIGR